MKKIATFDDWIAATRANARKGAASCSGARVPRAAEQAKKNWQTR